MAFKTGPSDNDAGGAPMSDINTTPLVDVMLVLLIIFLITVPVVIQTVPLDLPKVSNQPTTTKPENLNISVRSGADGCEYYFVQERMESTTQLRERAAKFLLAAVDKQKREQGAVTELPEAHLRVDSNTPYRCPGGAVFAVQYAGFQRVGFISEPGIGAPVVR